MQVLQIPSANSCLLRPTRPVRRSRVAWMYDSPEAAAAVTAVLTPSCIYDSIKTLHKDKVLVRAGAPFILRRTPPTTTTTPTSSH